MNKKLNQPSWQPFFSAILLVIVHAQILGVSLKVEGEKSTQYKQITEYKLFNLLFMFYFDIAIICQAWLRFIALNALLSAGL